MTTMEKWCWSERHTPTKITAGALTSMITREIVNCAEVPFVIPSLTRTTYSVPGFTAKGATGRAKRSARCAQQSWHQKRETEENMIT